MPWFFLYQQVDSAYVVDAAHALAGPCLLYDFSGFHDRPRRRHVDLADAVRAERDRDQGQQRPRREPPPFVEARGHSDWSLLIGDDRNGLASAEAGWDGAISGIAACCPELLVALHGAARSGQMALARACQGLLDELITHLVPRCRRHGACVSRFGVRGLDAVSVAAADFAGARGADSARIEAGFAELARVGGDPEVAASARGRVLMEPNLRDVAAGCSCGSVSGSSSRWPAWRHRPRPRRWTSGRPASSCHAAPRLTLPASGSPPTCFAKRSRSAPVSPGGRASSGRPMASRSRLQSGRARVGVVDASHRDAARSVSPGLRHTGGQAGRLDCRRRRAGRALRRRPTAAHAVVGARLGDTCRGRRRRDGASVRDPRPSARLPSPLEHVRRLERGAVRPVRARDRAAWRQCRREHPIPGHSCQPADADVARGDEPAAQRHLQEVRRRLLAVDARRLRSERCGEARGGPAVARHALCRPAEARRDLPAGRRPWRQRRVTGRAVPGRHRHAPRSQPSSGEGLAVAAALRQGRDRFPVHVDRSRPAGLARRAGRRSRQLPDSGYASPAQPPLSRPRLPGHHSYGAVPVPGAVVGSGVELHARPRAGEPPPGVLRQGARHAGAPHGRLHQLLRRRQRRLQQGAVVVEVVESRRQRA